MESFKVYWRRRKYRRLDGSRRGRKKMDQIQLGSKQRKRLWRIKIRRPRLRWFRLSSPKNLLIKLRDAYVRMMLSFANSAVFRGGYGYGIGDGVGNMGFGRPPLKEYDEKVILEIYKTLVARRQQQQHLIMTGKEGGGGGREIVLRR